MKDKGYSVNEILFAITNKETLEDRAGSVGNFDLLIPVMDAEIIIKNVDFTDRQREIFNMYYVQDFTLAMISDRLGISHQGVSDCLKQARRKIKKYIDRMEDNNNG